MAKQNIDITACRSTSPVATAYRCRVFVIQRLYSFNNHFLLQQSKVKKKFSTDIETND